MIFGIIVNEKSGSVPDNGSEILMQALSEAGHQVVRPEGESDDFTATIDALRAEGAEALIVWGGDGTIASVLQSTDGELPILILPGGTMNLLPKRLHADETDWEKVLSNVLKNPKPVWISAGEVNDQRFYVAALFGKMTKFGASREALREGDLIEAVSILTKSDALDVDNCLQVTVITEKGEEKTSATALSIMPEDKVGFEVASVSPDNHFDLATSAIGALFKGWREGADFNANAANRIIVDHAAGDEISCTIDGEPTDLVGPFEVIYIAKAACVLVSGDPS